MRTVLLMAFLTASGAMSVWPMLSGKIQQPLGRQHALGEARALQVGAGAALRQFGHRIADQVVVAFLAVHQQVVRVEMEAHVFGKIGQPEHRCLQADHFALRQQFIQPAHPGSGIAEGLEVEAGLERFAHALEDELGRHAVGDERETGELDEGQVGERQRGGQAERHRFGKRDAVMGHQIGGDAAFAVGRVAVLEIRIDRCSRQTVQSARACSPRAPRRSVASSCGRQSLKTLRVEVAADAPLPDAADLRQQRHIHAPRIHPVFQRRGLAAVRPQPGVFRLRVHPVHRLHGDGLVHFGAARRHDHHAAVGVPWRTSPCDGRCGCGCLPAERRSCPSHRFHEDEAAGEASALRHEHQQSCALCGYVRNGTVRPA